jgi:hypothetical protein
MTKRTEERKLQVLRDYAAGKLGTRRAIELAGFADYADLLIALAQNDLDLPKPADTPEHRAQVARAREILQPLLRNAGRG